MQQIFAQAHEFNESVRRLAQYRPFDDGGRNLEAVLIDLVLAAAEINDGAFASLKECQEAVQTLWTVEIEIDELRVARDKLVERELAASNGGGLQLLEAARGDLQKRETQARVIDEKALNQWETTTREARPDLSAEDLECLRADLAEWLGKIVVRHGAEAALILYPEDERAQRLFNEIEILEPIFCQSEVPLSWLFERRRSRRSSGSQRPSRGRYLRIA